MVQPGIGDGSGNVVNDPDEVTDDDESDSGSSDDDDISYDGPSGGDGYGGSLPDDDDGGSSGGSGTDTGTDGGATGGATGGGLDPGGGGGDGDDTGGSGDPDPEEEDFDTTDEAMGGDGTDGGGTGGGSDDDPDYSYEGPSGGDGYGGSLPDDGGSDGGAPDDDRPSTPADARLYNEAERLDEQQPPELSGEEARARDRIAEETELEQSEIQNVERTEEGWQPVLTDEAREERAREQFRSRFESTRSPAGAGLDPGTGTATPLAVYDFDDLEFDAGDEGVDISVEESAVRERLRRRAAEQADADPEDVTIEETADGEFEASVETEEERDTQVGRALQSVSDTIQEGADAAEQRILDFTGRDPGTVGGGAVSGAATAAFGPVGVVYGQVLGNVAPRQTDAAAAGAVSEVPRSLDLAGAALTVGDVAQFSIDERQSAIQDIGEGEFDAGDVAQLSAPLATEAYERRGELAAGAAAAAGSAAASPGRSLGRGVGLTGAAVLGGAAVGGASRAARAGRQAARGARPADDAVTQFLDDTRGAGQVPRGRSRGQSRSAEPTGQQTSPDYDPRVFERAQGRGGGRSGGVDPETGARPGRTGGGQGAFREQVQRARRQPDVDMREAVQSDLDAADDAVDAAVGPSAGATAGGPAAAVTASARQRLQEAQGPTVTMDEVLAGQAEDTALLDDDALVDDGLLDAQLDSELDAIGQDVDAATRSMTDADVTAGGRTGTRGDAAERAAERAGERGAAGGRGAERSTEATMEQITGVPGLTTGTPFGETGTPPGSPGRPPRLPPIDPALPDVPPSPDPGDSRRDPWGEVVEFNPPTADEVGEITEDFGDIDEEW